MFIALIIVLCLLSAAAIAGTLVLVSRDGYAARPEVLGYDTRHPAP